MRLLISLLLQTSSSGQTLNQFVFKKNNSKYLECGWVSARKQTILAFFFVYVRRLLFRPGLTKTPSYRKARSCNTSASISVILNCLADLLTHNFFVCVPFPSVLSSSHWPTPLVSYHTCACPGPPLSVSQFALLSFSQQQAPVWWLALTWWTRAEVLLHYA